MTDKVITLAEVQMYARAPWGSQKWYVLITDPNTGEQAVCGHSHTSAELANKCADKHSKRNANNDLSA